MQIIKYVCDQCKTDFGDTRHLNLKPSTINLYWSDKGKGDIWVSETINIPGGEMHFCNKECLTKWIKRHITGEIHGKDRDLLHVAELNGGHVDVYKNSVIFHNDLAETCIEYEWKDLYRMV